MTPREEFGPALRRERERRGISLEQIADRTKISASLFAAMERNDFSRWPNGIFRRSFLRAYAEVVGVDGDALVERFLEAYPGPDHETALPQAGSAAPPTRATHPERHPRVQATATIESDAAGRSERRERVAATLADLGLVALLAGVGWLFGGWFGVGPAAALAGMLIFVVGNVLLGRTPGSWLVGAGYGNAAAPTLAVASHPVAPAKRVMADERERVTAKRRPTMEAHQAARRHTVRRLDRSRSRRA